MISGFNDPEHVEYFSPAMSKENNPDGQILGWIQKEYCTDGTRQSDMTPVFFSTMTLQAFYIQLDGEYPWLESESESCEIPSGVKTTIQLDSYYDGSTLEISGVPSWLTADIKGRHDLTELSLKAESGTEGEAVITVAGPGVEKSITVKATLSGIGDVLSPGQSVMEIHTVQETRTESMDTSGIYIVRTSDGKVRKVIR